MTANASPDNRWLFKTGGLCTFVLWLAYVATVVLYFSVGKLPSDGAAWLTFLGGKTALWWTIIGLSVLTDLLFIPLALALYASLSRTSRLPSLIPLALMALWVPLDLAGTWSHYASLMTLSGRYAGPATAAQRAPIVAAADYGAAFLGSRLEAVFTTGLLSFAILLGSVVMRKSGFGKAASWSGIGGGFFGMLAVTGWNLPVLLNVIGVGLWFFLVSLRLYFSFGGSASATARPAAGIPVQAASRL